MNVKENRKLYGNWEVYHPDGELMFRCDEKKANWYLQRNLANLLGNNKIQLTFVPRGKGHVNEPFYLVPKQNICVVCGTDKFLTRHHAVPYCFRKFFPENLKSKNSHDVVLLCNECHNNYETYAWELKMKIAEENGIVVHMKLADISDEEKQKSKAISFAHSLIRYGDEIPENRKQELRDFISPYVPNVGIDEIRKFRDDNYAHMARVGQTQEEGWTLGEAIMNKVKDLDAFVKTWRQHFILVMQPKFLPDLWSVEHTRKKNED